MTDDEQASLENELNDWLFSINTSGFIASLSVDKWIKGKPRKITIQLTFKTGDGADQPYSEEPPDESVIKLLEEAGWKTEVEGIMIYGVHCKICKEDFKHDEVAYDKNGNPRCPKCGAKMEEIVGSKWIHGYKTLQLKGKETVEEIKQLIEQTIEEVAQDGKQP